MPETVSSAEQRISVRPLTRRCRVPSSSLLRVESFQSKAVGGGSRHKMLGTGREKLLLSSVPFIFVHRLYLF